MAPGNHSQATLICFIYLGTKHVCVCVGKHMHVWRGRPLLFEAASLKCSSVCCQLDPSVEFI